MLDVLLCHGELLVGLVHLECNLVYLQLNHLASLGQFEIGNGGSTLRRAYLIHYVAPIPDGHTNHHTYVPHA